MLLWSQTSVMSGFWESLRFTEKADASALVHQSHRWTISLQRGTGPLLLIGPSQSVKPLPSTHSNDGDHMNKCVMWAPHQGTVIWGNHFMTFLTHAHMVKCFYRHNADEQRSVAALVSVCEHDSKTEKQRWWRREEKPAGRSSVTWCEQRGLVKCVSRSWLLSITPLFWHNLQMNLW